MGAAEGKGGEQETEMERQRAGFDTANKRRMRVNKVKQT